jgi:hypothetical protein
MSAFFMGREGYRAGKNCATDRSNRNCDRESQMLKEKRCQLLEIIHARQQELDQLDYQIYKLVRQQATGEVE